MKKYFLVLVPILFLACGTPGLSKNYDEFDIVETEKGQYYFLSNEDSNSLMIYIDGSGLSSVLGTADDGNFKSHSYAFVVSEYFHSFDSILVPEKPGMTFGGAHYADSDVIMAYTVESLSAHYAESINIHLTANRYERICIIGVSEGGLLLPIIYSQLEDQDSIDALVIIGAGGLSQYACFQIQYENYPELPSEYRDQLALLEEQKELIKHSPDSIVDSFLGWPYRRWSSFFEYSPLDFLNDIKIPILYIQGLKDLNSPYESVSAIEDVSLPNVEIRFIAEMGHLPGSKKEIDFVLGQIQQWRTEN